MQADEKINARQSAVDQAIRYVDEHFYDSDLSLELLAQQSYLSKNYFALLFEQQTGCKFKQYIQNKRVILACELLGSTDRTISDIMAQCGYRDNKHFYSTFKKIAGKTPSEYRMEAWGRVQTAKEQAMQKNWSSDAGRMVSELVLPVAIKDQKYTQDGQNLLEMKEPCISFSLENMTGLLQKGAYIVLDFGKEVAGALRLLTRGVGNGPATLRITLGESLTEACSRVGEGTATNDHSPRDFTVLVSNMSDLTFGQSAFRFARVEVVSEHTVWFRSIYAVNNMLYLENEGHITTDDPLLNQIIDTAQYTLKLNFQNGYIWDGVKRDRLVWCGDLNPEILSGLYLLGGRDNIKNSLRFLREDTPKGKWMNTIPSYSAWWVINLCDYCRISGDWEFFQEHKDYALEILTMLDNAVKADGQIDFGKVESDMPFFLDWPTFQTEDAVTGTAVLLRYAAMLYLQIENNESATALCEKLQPYLEKPCKAKCVRAFQILAGRRAPGDAEFLEDGGAKGLSTFMAYYILKADAMVGGTQMLPMLKEYYGGMLQRGATTFWEDFDLDWLEGSGRIDAFPAAGQKDIHADYGNFCYKGLRHSLCHGWSAGILAFLVEWVLGLTLFGNEKRELNPRMLGLKNIDAAIPVTDGILKISLRGERAEMNMLKF